MALDTHGDGDIGQMGNDTWDAETGAFAAGWGDGTTAASEARQRPVRPAAPAGRAESTKRGRPCGHPGATAAEARSQGTEAPQRASAGGGTPRSHDSACARDTEGSW